MYNQLKIEWGFCLQKIISECCELAKLCHINGSGPVFLDTLVQFYLDGFHGAHTPSSLTFVYEADKYWQKKKKKKRFD